LQPTPAKPVYNPPPPFVILDRGIPNLNIPNPTVQNQGIQFQGAPQNYGT